MNGRYSIRRVPAVASFVTMCVLLAGCSMFGGDDDPAPAKKTQEPAPAVAWTTAKPAQVRSGGTLRIGTGALPANFNPEHASNSDLDLSTLLSPTVGSAVRITADGSWEVDPNYARSVKVVDRDPLRVEVKLNRKAVWQAGTPITAADMIAYVKAHDGSDDAYQVTSTRGFDTIDTVEQGDDEFEYTVMFDEPIADWPRFIYPALPEAVSSSATKFNERFVERSIPSNGPFVVRSIDRERGQVVMEPNHRWWGSAPKLEKIVWQAADPGVQIKAVETDELDVVHVAPEQIADLDGQQVDGATVQAAGGTEWTQLTMNGARGALADVRVRRAVALALDRTELTRLSVKGLDVAPTVQGSFVLVPGQAGYSDRSEPIATDTKAAAALLDKAGWTLSSDATIRQRKGTDLRLVMPVPTRTPTIERRAEAIAKQLGTVGIAVDLQSVDAEDYYTGRIIPLDFDLATFSHVGSAFPVVESEALFHPVDSGQNFTGLDDDELADLWSAASSALTDTARDAAVAKVDDRLFRDVPIVPLGVVPDVAVVRDTVVNIGAHQFQRPDWTVVGFRAQKKDG